MDISKLTHPPCRFFIEGRCKHGETCAFAHSTGPAYVSALREWEHDVIKSPLIVLWDADNLQSALFTVLGCGLVPGTVYIVSFCVLGSRHKRLCAWYDRYAGCFAAFQTLTTREDAADNALAMCLTRLILRAEGRAVPEFVIVSRDGFAKEVAAQTRRMGWRCTVLDEGVISYFQNRGVLAAPPPPAQPVSSGSRFYYSSHPTKHSEALIEVTATGIKIIKRGSVLAQLAPNAPDTVRKMREQWRNSGVVASRGDRFVLLQDVEMVSINAAVASIHCALHKKHHPRRAITPERAAEIAKELEANVVA